MIKLISKELHMECPTFRANNQLHVDFHSDIIDKRKLFNTHLNVCLEIILIVVIFQNHVFYLRRFGRFRLKTLSNFISFNQLKKKIYLPVIGNL